MFFIQVIIYAVLYKQEKSEVFQTPPSPNDLVSGGTLRKMQGTGWGNSAMW